MHDHHRHKHEAPSRPTRRRFASATAEDDHTGQIAAPGDDTTIALGSPSGPASIKALRAAGDDGDGDALPRRGIAAAVALIIALSAVALVTSRRRRRRPTES